MRDDPRKKLVEAGYDALGERYAAWRARVEGDPRDRFVPEFSRRLPAGARVLDLGCDPGVPTTRLLAECFEVVGVDLSQAQVELARRNVPGATFIHGDFSELSWPPASFAGIVALYSLSHVPRGERAALFGRIAGWLEPGGLILAVLGAGKLPDSSEEWLGVPMFFSSHDADMNRTLLRSVGFDLVRDEIVEMREPEGPVSFLWTLARKADWRRHTSSAV